MYIPDLGFGVGGGWPLGAARGGNDDDDASGGQYNESRAASTHGPSGDPGDDTNIFSWGAPFQNSTLVDTNLGHSARTHNFACPPRFSIQNGCTKQNLPSTIQKLHSTLYIYIYFLYETVSAAHDMHKIFFIPLWHLHAQNNNKRKIACKSERKM